ncbi:MAG: tRNA threonylcarbamoyladenosine dehydratase [Eubacteriales bacterium]|nr:tRNA threonylcarbamoyladenosine dehydratase [Eubacteriales bacterium]
MDFLSRTQNLIGKEAVNRLQNSRVMVFGLGGVGSWAAEALARTGIGGIYLIDRDQVEASNLNRQLPALHSTLGQSKAQALADRLLDINPDLYCEAWPERYEVGNGPDFFSRLAEPVDFVMDCIDDLSAKTDLIYYCAGHGIPIISAGGCAKRLDPSLLQLQDIYKTSGDPLLKPLRKNLRDLGVVDLPVVSSREKPQASKDAEVGVLPSAVFVPAACGLEMARQVCLDLAGLVKLSRAQLVD